MAKDLKKAAQDALDFNPHLEKVFVTSDGTPFINENDAVNHARKFDDKTVAVFERDGDEDDTAGDEVKLMLAKDLIVLIEGAESEEAVNTLLGKDVRATVKAAAAKRISELKQKAIDEQAAAADEALAQRESQA